MKTNKFRREGILVLCAALALLSFCSDPPPPDADADAGDGDADADTDSSICTEDDDCDDMLFCTGEERCFPDSPDADERGCVLGDGVVCEDDAECDEDEDECIFVACDEDGDGHETIECGGDDCDDDDAHRYPGNVEVCDGADHDEDCDPTTFGDRDEDDDGFVDDDCCNEDLCGEDCDDFRSDRYPGLVLK